MLLFSAMKTSHVWLFAGALLLGPLSACKGDAKSGGTESVVKASESIAESENDLLARRDALLASRTKLREEREKIAVERRELTERGGDTEELDRRADELLAQEKELGSEESSLNQLFGQLVSQRREMIDALASAGSESSRVAARESTMAAREKDLASREDRLAKREKELADRERAQALREKETCGVAAAPTTIIQTIDAKGSKYTKKDVEPLLSKARKSMSKKGVLDADLPDPAQRLESEATKAMADGDYGKARFAAAQLLATVDSIKIDKAFIAAKISRLSRSMKGVKLEGSKQGEVDSLFQEATANYGDGAFGDANRRLNKIYGIIR